MTIKNFAKNLLKKEIGPAILGSFLRAVRTAMDATQIEMGKILGVSKSVICDIERGRHMVGPKLAYKIACKAGLSTVLAVQLCLQDQLRLSKI